MKQKLIDQLIHKAGARFGGDGINYDLFVPSKFAELIVRECMSCAQFVGITNDRIGLGPMPIRYTSMVNDQIKKHFGVEE
jgi:hypothetical protein